MTALGIATAASAQVDEALDTPGTAADTDFTPHAKPTELWQQVGGASFPAGGSDGTELVAGSPTPFDADLHAVSFRNADHGFVGGSVCAQAPVREPGESAEDYGRRVSACERVPVIYRYTKTAVSGEAWEEVYRGESPGFVAAIAWIDSQRVVAVGGDGTYPEREAEYRTTDPTETYETWAERDPAGEGRAWLLDPGRYGDGAWHELSTGAGELPAGTRGMTALDFHPGSGEELGAAGALGQLVEWRDGRFSRLVDSESPTAVIENPARLRYRVRDIRFLPQEVPQAFGVTAGCCAATPAQAQPRVLAYTGQDGRWFVRSAGWQNVDRGVADVPAGAGVELPDSFYSLTATEANGFSEYLVSVLASPGGTEQEVERASVNSQPHCIERRADGNILLQAYFGSNDPALEALRTTLASSRLVDGDGDIGKAYSISNRSEAEVARGEWRASPNNLTAGGTWCFPPDLRGDGVPDWQIGGLRSTAVAGLGSRALAVASHLDPSLFPEVIQLNPESRDPETMEPRPSDLAGGSYRPTTPERASAYLASTNFFLPSYALSAIDVIGETGAGWAVGAHGAILRLGEGSAGSGEQTAPQPPTLGAARTAPTANRDAYEAHRPATADRAAAVPPLTTQPRRQLDTGQLFSAGSPDPTREVGELVEDVSAIVMSRDGAEGWAIGPTGASNPSGSQTAATTFYRFDGDSWSRCDPVGIPGRVPPDPACEALAGLRAYREGSDESIERRVVRLTAAARVPLEADSDPTNDDELEIVAVGTDYSVTPDAEKRPVMLRYSDGRWDFERIEAREAIGSDSNSSPSHIAFSSPDDGWLLTSQAKGAVALYHWDGERWNGCGARAAECDQPGGRGTFAPPLGDDADADVVLGLVAAGERVYLYGYRSRNGVDYPMILHRDPHASAWEASDGGLDPGFDSAASAAAPHGQVESLAVAPDRSDGWAVGDFGPGAPADPQTALLRLEGGLWSEFADTGPFGDYMRAGPEDAVDTVNNAPSRTNSNLQVTLGAGRAFIAQHNSPTDQGVSTGRIFSFDQSRQRWRLLDTERPRNTDAPVDGGVQALAPDGAGGFWTAIRNENIPSGWDQQRSHVGFFHYTDRPPADVFAEVQNPFTATEHVTALTGAADGTVWAGTDSDVLYRYDRITGWERIRIPGWDPGRVVTRTSEVNAIAVNASGEGVAVGKAGRIAEIAPQGVGLSSAAGTACDVDPAPPCGTGRDLIAVATAPDGTALAGGERRTLLWRPAGGEFRAVQAPDAAASSTITGISMPSADSAWLTTDTGLVFAGSHAGGGGWSWRLENVDEDGNLISTDANDTPLSLRAVAVDSSGDGYAVGDRGVVLERSGEGSSWRRLDTGFLDDLTAVTLPVGGGRGALVGGRNDVILTLAGDRFEVARFADYQPGPESSDRSVPGRTKRIVGLALLPGAEPGEAEAWAASQALVRPTGGLERLYHYASDPDEPLLDPTRGIAPLPDFEPDPDALSFAAFGKSDCAGAGCVMEGSTDRFEVTSRAVVDSILAGSADVGRPRFAIFTGDAADSAGEPGSDDSPALRRWTELVADPLAEGGVPLFGAIGGQDLSEVRGCVAASCLVGTGAGDNLAWREAMSGRPDPWGGGPAAAASGVSFVPVADGDEVTVSSGGARSHYAADVVEAGERVARIVFVDTSLRSLAAGEGTQEPVEGGGGQSAWLERMLCTESSATTATGECTREPGQPAIVVSNTPTYSYGPGALEETQTDATTFEALLMRHDASLVVSGRLGWNARYWATAPGVHAPCPGDPYMERPPEPGDGRCGDLSGGEAVDAPAAAPDPTDPVGEEGLDGLLPFVVAASAGATLGPDGHDDGATSDGFWHGYSIVHLDLETGEVGVEQRPVFDWLRLSASDHAIPPRGRLRLEGVGREAIGPTAGNETAFFAPGRYDSIDSAAITHRYDLLLADPDEPWLPCREGDPGCESLAANLAARAAAEGEPAETSEPNDCAPYLCLPDRVGTVNRTTGEVRAGDGRYPQTFAVAMLSVAERSATYPLVFERSPSFVVRSALRTLGAPAPLEGAGATAPPPPPTPDVPKVPEIEVPAVPVPPAIPLLAAASPPEPQAPVPPAPPPPAQQPSPLDLSVAPTGVSVTPPTALIQPPTPPVNPAPPGGARREARQRQAAAQKSGADAESQDAQGEGGVDPTEASGRVNQVDSQVQQATRHSGNRMESPATRRDRARPGPSFTVATDQEQASAWTTGALYGGTVALMALVMALGWSRSRPTPRRREPELPAPAWNRRGR